METKLATLISKSKQIYSTFKFEDHSEGLSDFSQSNQKKNLVYVTSFDSTISVYDIDATKSVSVLKAHTKGVWSCSTNPQSQQLVTGGNDNKIILWDCKQNLPIEQIEKHSEVIYDVQFSSNGKYFGSCSKGLICIWDTSKLSEPIKTLKYDIHNHNSFIYCLNFLNDDKKIITGFIDGTIIISDIHSDNFNKYTLPNMKAEFYKEAQGEYSNSIYSLTKFKASDKILVAHSDGSVRIFDTSKGKFDLIDTYSYFCDPVTSANSSSDDSLLVGCSKDRFGQVWPTMSHDVINYTLIGHNNIVSACNFLNNNLIGTCSYDNTFCLWKI